MPTIKLYSITNASEIHEIEYSNDSETINEILLKSGMHTTIHCLAIGDTIIRNKDTKIGTWLAYGDMLSYVPKEPSIESINILIATTAPSHFLLNISQNALVEDLKHLIEEKTEIPKDVQRLMHADEVLNDYVSLSDYGISQGSVINLRLFHLRSSTVFGYVNTAKKPQKVERAPEWRIAHKGFCIEGVCYNKKCKAYLHDVVINKKYGVFRMDIEPIACPMCNSSVRIGKFAFNNCHWRFVGVRRCLDAPKRLKSEWEKVGNEYWVMKRQPGGVDDWKIMVFEVTDRMGRYSVEADCAICLDFFSDSRERELKCGHRFHEICLHWNWGVSACPICRATASK